MPLKFYWVVRNRFTAASFYYNTKREAETLLKLMESSLFYGEGRDWEIHSEPRS
jgi:hypothetical protein